MSKAKTAEDPGSNPGRGTYCRDGKSPTRKLPAVKYRGDSYRMTPDRIRDYEYNLRNAVQILSNDPRMTGQGSGPEGIRLEN